MGSRHATTGAGAATVRRLLGIGLAVALVTPAATGAAGATGRAAVRGAAVADPVAEAAAASGVVARGSVNQVQVIAAPAGATLELLDAAGATVATGTADSLGGYLFHQVAAAEGYRVLLGGGDVPARELGPLTVTDPDDVPPASLYTGQTLNAQAPGQPAESGYGYVTTRDGTKLSISISLPGPASGGPYPTLLEYSGYDPSNPGAGQPIIKIIAQLLGYAYVGVNIRGTGCSGGAFDFFETLQGLDGYDAIETVAAQPWAGRIAMAGISYPGISQLFVARTRPPHLTAITPLSVIDDTFRGTLYPGGIFNDGFALGWATDRVEQNRWPDPIGNGWAVDRINAGDRQCAFGMLLRGQNREFLQQIEDNQFFPPVGSELYPPGGDALAPASFVDEIDVPTFIAGAWQDEQTGGHWPNMLANFTAVPKGALRITAQNGTHADALDPEIMARMLEFLDFYVARRIPSIPAAVRAAAPIIYQTISGVPGVQLPPDRFTGYSSFESALAAYQAEPPVRILWENGARPGATPGSPEPAGDSLFSQWPPKETSAAAWYLQPDGRLDPQPPTLPDDEPRGVDSYVYDPSARPRSNFTGSSSDIWLADPDYDWTPLVDGKALSYVSAPLAHDTAMVGTGSVDLWLSSTAPDTDLQVTLTEVRPDGQERYVQNGWLRASQRKLDAARSRELHPVHSHLETDAAPLPADELVPVRVGIFPFGHVFRAGTRIRLSIEAPGGDRPLWTFRALSPTGTVVNSIAHTAGMPSRVVLPVVPGVDLAAPLAPCPSLRAQPCRDFVAPALATGVTAEGSGGTVAVGWSPAPARAGQPVTGYRVTATPGGATRTVGATTTSVAFDGLAPGRYSFTVAALLGSGAGPESSASPRVTVAAPMPRPVITRGPVGVVAARHAELRFTTEPGLTYRCYYDAVRSEPCTSRVRLNHLSPGYHVFEVRPVDAHGNVGPGQFRVWQVGRPPSVRIRSGPSGAETGTEADLLLRGSTARLGYVCSLDGATPSRCGAEPHFEVAPGWHVVRVWRADRHGEPTGRPDFRLWVAAAG